MPSLSRPVVRAVLTAVLVLPLGAGDVPADSSFVEFESGQVRPLALSPDTGHLFAVNSPDDRLEIFDVSGGGLVHQASVPVGLEPVAVAVRTNTEVWVVNHLSDSVSIVDVSSSPPRVTRTLLTCDEPRDIVFAGPGNSRAFITTARRGQNCIGASAVPVDPKLTTPGTGRALVQVFDTGSLGASLGGTPLKTIELFGDTPRALAVSPDGNTVYAAVFQSGNQTTTVSEGLVCNGGSSAGPCTIGDVNAPGGLPAPSPFNCTGQQQAETGLIVQFNQGSSKWEDELGRDWSSAVRFSLPDEDVFTIDANTLLQTSNIDSVGTVIFNLAVNPVSGKVYVSNTEARNEVRFEGSGGACTPHPTVRGHLHEARITVLDGSNPPAPRHLNKHIDYSVVPSPAGVKDNSLAIPVGMAVSSDGATLWVAAFGSSKVGKFTTASLEADTFVPSSANHVTLSGGGPSGLVLRGNRLYVLTRFDNAISVVDTGSNTEIDHQPVFNPEPASVVIGRPFLYDAYNTSSNGEAACAVCHVFGDFDSLGWDLGDPTLVNFPDNNPKRVDDPFSTLDRNFRALKGPMTTQSLRGLANHGPMHWRGDRQGPAGQTLREDLAFEAFNVAFGGLLGRSGPIASTDMEAFTNFILQVNYPPNPIRALDNSLTPDEQAGHDFYFNTDPSDTFEPCNGCHVLNPTAGFFGTDGFSSFENEPQFFKIPHLRNAYQKVGMFGMAAVAFFNSGDNASKGPQVRGFGFLHDGSVDTLFRFHNAVVFDPHPPIFSFPANVGFPDGPAGDTLRRQVEQFVLAFDSNMAPIVGQQITLTSSNSGTAGPRIDLLEARAAAGECDVVAKGALGGVGRGWYRRPDGMFESDCAGDLPVSDTTLRGQASGSGQELTYTCVPPGSGFRIGVDRDSDGFADGTERDAATDPADRSSFPLAGASVPIRTSALSMRDSSRAQSRKIAFRSSTTSDGPSNRIVPPSAGSGGDPTATGSGCGGATLTVYNSSGAGNDMATALLPAANWTVSGTPTAPQYRYVDKNSNGPVKKVIVKADKITIRGGRSNWLYTLNEASQGSVAVRLTLGTGASWCAEAGRAPFPASIDQLNRFVAQGNTPAPASCPPTP